MMGNSLEGALRETDDEVGQLLYVLVREGMHVRSARLVALRVAGHSYEEIANRTNNAPEIVQCALERIDIEAYLGRRTQCRCGRFDLTGEELAEAPGELFHGKPPEQTVHGCVICGTAYVRRPTGTYAVEIKRGGI